MQSLCPGGWRSSSSAYKCRRTKAGHADFGGRFGAPQVKIIEEGFTLKVFGVLSISALKENLRWTDIAAFTLIFTGVCVGALGERLG